jgi:spore coat polysaccharide biosynthesis protein SpsF
MEADANLAETQLQKKAGKTAVFITARLKSTRLPRKVLAELCGKPLLLHLIERVRLARLPDLVVLCTSTHGTDDPLEELARRNDILYFRGSEEDVLERYLQAAEQFQVEFAAITWGDEVFCDPVYIDETIRRFYRDPDQPDMVTSDSLPEGTYTYGVRIKSLREVVKAKSQSNTEVWTKYFETNHKYHVAQVAVASELERRDLRLTCDYPEDLELIRIIFRNLFRGSNDFQLAEIIRFLDEHPALRNLNYFRQKEYDVRIESQSVCE